MPSESMHELSDQPTETQQAASLALCGQRHPFELELELELELEDSGFVHGKHAEMPS